MRSFLEDKFYLVLSLAVLCFSVLTWASWTTEPEDMIKNIVQISRTSKEARQPASIEMKKMEVKPKKLAFQHLRWNFCSRKPSEKTDLVVRGQFVQLKGKLCPGEKPSIETAEIEIINDSSGYTASIFATGKNEYQTDLIQLKEGRNQIRLIYSDKGKKTEQRLELQAITGKL